MIADDVRSDAYQRALRAVVSPGAVVADIGTGTGFFAILACRFGASRVFAIESSDMIEIARRIAAANGCADRIEFIQAVSTEIALPTRADVIVADLHGVLPFFTGNLASMIDARERFLAAGGAMIPLRESVWVAGVEAPELHRPVTSPWTDNKYGLKMEAARALAANQWRRAVVDPGQLVTSPQCCGNIDYSKVVSTDLDAMVQMPASRSGEGHGLCVWFDTVLAPGVGFSNAPGAPDLVYGSAFFPWPEAVALQKDDCIEARLRARFMQGKYLWTWETRILRGETEMRRFRQSEFFSEPLAPDKVRRHAASHVPHLGEDGRIDGLILALMQEQLPLGDIARRIAEGFPGRFSSWQDALARVADLSVRYSRST